MKIRVTPQQARALRLSEEPLFVRSAFYLGHSYSEIIYLVSSLHLTGERTTIIRLARELGLSDDDTVEVVYADP